MNRTFIPNRFDQIFIVARLLSQNWMQIMFCDVWELLGKIKAMLNKLPSKSIYRFIGILEFITNLCLYGWNVTVYVIKLKQYVYTDKFVFQILKHTHK